MPEILLDTSFLLPTLGVEVEEISSKDLETLRGIRQRTGLCCSHVSFVEILGLLGKSKKIDDSAVGMGIKSLFASGAYKWVTPSSSAIHLAFELRSKGHKDNIDNILYATAVDSGMLFLSLDKELKGFLQENGYASDIIVAIKDLPGRV
jgi:predicted nucleic-acid-binding protein